MTRQYDKSVAEAVRGVELDPNSAIAHDLLGMCLSYAGRHDEAIPMYKKAIRLEPLAAGKYYRDLGKSYLFMDIVMRRSQRVRKRSDEQAIICSCI